MKPRHYNTYSKKRDEYQKFQNRTFSLDILIKNKRVNAKKDAAKNLKPQVYNSKISVLW